MGFYYLLNSSKDYQKIENEDKKDEEFKNHKQEMGIERDATLIRIVLAKVNSQGSGRQKPSL